MHKVLLKFVNFFRGQKTTYEKRRQKCGHLTHILAELSQTKNIDFLWHIHAKPKKDSDRWNGENAHWSTDFTCCVHGYKHGCDM